MSIDGLRCLVYTVVMTDWPDDIKSAFSNIAVASFHLRLLHETNAPEPLRHIVRQSLWRFLDELETAAPVVFAGLASINDEWLGSLAPGPRRQVNNADVATTSRGVPLGDWGS